ncbi:hypothetical protein HY643_03905 [Candidatus Woesearchaeota archaeon]|nr:hypothetical protein [Candidatus Woesearchaeota archaeon]
MKKALIIFCVMQLLLLSFVSAADTREGTCNLKVDLINQDPYPAIPGEYVDVLFQVSGVQTPSCEGARFEMMPSYPFSVDGNSTVKVLEGSTYVADHKNDWMIPYKLRVDKDALKGYPEIKVMYSPNMWEADSRITKFFNISVEDARTNFDAVIQEVSGSDVSIAIANIGKYTANAVVVRVPQQESFVAVGTDGQMIGNLESGDYTITSFSIAKKGTQRSSTLKFDIYYTDSIGERRIINLERSLGIADSSTGLIGGFAGIGNFTGRSSAMSGMHNASSSQNSIYYYGAAIALVFGVGGFIFARKRSTKHGFSRASTETPAWVKNVKGKEEKN